LISLAVGIVRAQANSTNQVQEQFQNTIGNWLNFFQTNINWLSAAFINFLKNVIKAIYFTLGIIGFVMWSTGISKYSGRRLLIGAIALALVSQIFL
jgi:type IV secretory pathway TrbL component